MTARRIQRQRRNLEQRYAIVNDTTALAMWMKAEAAAERASRARTRMYDAMFVGILLLTGVLTVAVLVLLVDLVVGG